MRPSSFGTACCGLAICGFGGPGGLGGPGGGGGLEGFGGCGGLDGVDGLCGLGVEGFGGVCAGVVNLGVGVDELAIWDSVEVLPTLLYSELEGTGAFPFLTCDMKSPGISSSDSDSDSDGGVSGFLAENSGAVVDLVVKSADED